MECPRCRHDNPDEANFCAQCGVPLGSDSSTLTDSLLSDEVPDPVDEQLAAEMRAVARQLEPGTALLVVSRGPNRGARFLLDRPVVSVGRHPASDIFLDDITVSRKHSEFRKSGETYEVVDTDSLNGTYVGGERVSSHELSSGDEVRIGKFKLVAFTTQEPAEA